MATPHLFSSAEAAAVLWQALKLSPLLALLCVLLLAELRRAPVPTSGSGPPTYPVIGCLISFYRNRRRLLDWYTELIADSRTGTIVVDRLGATRTIVTTNLENVEYILKTRFGNFPKGRPFTDILGDFLGKGIFNADGDLWRSQRKLACHQFSVRSLRNYTIGTLRDGVQTKLMPVLERLAEENRVIDLQELLTRFAFDMICKFSLGVDHGSIDPALPVSTVIRAFDSSSMICALRGAAPLFLIWKVKRWAQVGSEKRLSNSVCEVHQYVNSIIDERASKMKMEKTGTPDDLGELDLLSRMLLNGHDKDVIRDMVISFVMAGRDTTSAAMTWLLWAVSQNPKAEAELVSEIVDFKESELNYDSIKELRFLEACLLEAMRLYPPVAWDSKHAIQDDLLPDGTLVRSGDRVTYFPYGMGRMETLWGKDRLEFKPDRWFVELDGGRGVLKKVCPYRYPVFQAGPRDCIGKEMAFVQMKYVVASILRHYEIKPVRRGKPVFVPLLTAHMAGGSPVRICKRKD
ncbi:cytochrome P450 94B3-like [Punica granatum]|uniref:Uncharacterized protein n=2 Tax=Punica granatum TaxID=22663 RepID=A0A218WFJ4_PUNGR|nr:cytochrome P450 94B3-like [Punica granatum]OWM71436.1 hypothetical protein CDL15_Pgr005623 [Punica granatum]PKI60348.1 hypothetical protein CRG98_019284 [Punica granatum]